MDKLKNQGITYGRRKWIPLLIASGGLAAWHAITAFRPVYGSFQALVAIWCVVWAWRYWVVPMTPRMERRKYEGVGAREFGSKLWHRLAIAFLALIVAGIIAIIIGSAVHPSH